MKIKYEFVNGKTEVEVSEEWGSVLLELDRQEYNNNHKEKRRHFSLDAYDEDLSRFAAEDDVLQTVIDAATEKEIMDAIHKLSIPQRDVVLAILYHDTPFTVYAKEKGISLWAAHKNYNLALKNLKNILHLG